MAKIIEFKSITKVFPGVTALNNVSFDLEPGEIHVVIGENGAGKSTLMKVLSGAHKIDEGALVVNGNVIENNDPRKAEELGISMIYQELNLIPELSIADNIFLGHEIKKNKLFLDRKTMEKKANELLNQIGIYIDSSILVKDLSIASQQMVEIAKALSKDAKVLVFDEPTSSLTNAEITELFRIIRNLKKKQVGMFYISHRLEELFEIGDKVTILRDGNKIATKDIKDVTMEELIEDIAGRKIDKTYPHRVSKAGEKVFEAKNLESRKFKNINFHVNKGEIVGFSGLVGAGRTEVARAIFGLDDYDNGEVFIEGNKLPKRNAKLASQMGISYLPEDRKAEGLALSLNLIENSVIAATRIINPKGIINKKGDRVQTDKYIEDLSIVTPSAEKLAKFLSGGNQQKVVIAKWLMTKAKMFIFDEPTRGIDVGAKASIYELMNRLVEEGAAIVMISSDLPELIGMCDRMYVMSGGEIVGELKRGEFDQENILQMSFSKV